MYLGDGQLEVILQALGAPSEADNWDATTIKNIKDTVISQITEYLNR
jgi:hypothetical protein